MTSEQGRARILTEERRQLGIKYKDLTPDPLREYAYEINRQRYRDPLGPTYEYLKEVTRRSGIAAVAGRSWRRLPAMAFDSNREYLRLAPVGFGATL